MTFQVFQEALTDMGFAMCTLVSYSVALCHRREGAAYAYEDRTHQEYMYARSIGRSGICIGGPNPSGIYVCTFNGGGLYAAENVL